MYRRTEGNPLFVEALLDNGELGSGLPESLRDLLVAAVRRLPEETQEVVRVASAGGERTDHGLLAAVTGLDGSALARALRPAVAANVLLTDSDGYLFRHALIREAVHDELLPGEPARAQVLLAPVHYTLHVHVGWDNPELRHAADPAAGTAASGRRRHRGDCVLHLVRGADRRGTLSDPGPGCPGPGDRRPGQAFQPLPGAGITESDMLEGCRPA